MKAAVGVSYEDLETCLMNRVVSMHPLVDSINCC